MHRPFLVFAAAFCLLAAMSFHPASAQAQSSDSGADTEKRIQRLEEQIVDLSAQLGTVESLSRGGGGGAAPAAPFPGGGSDSGGGADAGRLGDIETQVRALSSQMNEILRRLNQIERRSGSLSPSREPDAGSRDYGSAQGDRGSSRQAARPAEEGTGFSVGANEQPINGFDSSIEQDADGNPVRSDQGSAAAPAPATRPAPAGRSPADAGSSAAARPSADVGSAGSVVRTSTRSSPEAKAAYDKAYGALIQRNYRVASDGFGEFVKSYSNDPLAGPAYFWLGESAFTLGEYKQAADSFLKSSTNYPDNEKAAESLLKLGISLKRLGENQAACQSFAELARRFPSATPVLQRAEKEKSRAQC